MKLRIRPQMIISFLMMSALLFVVVICAIFYTNRMQENTARILVENVSSLKSAEELEIALLDMKGLTANYLLDGDEKWLEIFHEKQLSFINWFNNARERIHSDEEDRVIDEIEGLYERYTAHQRNVVISYQKGDFSRAHALLIGDMRDTFNLVYQKCEELLSLNEHMMHQTSMSIERDKRSIKKITFGIGIVGILLGTALGLGVSRSITHPIYELVLKVKGATSEELIEKVDISEETELEHLSKYVRRLIERVHEVNKDLEQSQRMLIRSEKLATIGQMAAGLAHEIRNPLTAVKMLIFTLQQEAKGNFGMKRDFEVILKEIERLERFLGNFLTFARPPEPNRSYMDINETVRHTLNLLSPQTKAKGIAVKEMLCKESAPVYGDREQLQIVLVNVILNAIQSITTRGMITVASGITKETNGQCPHVYISISDNGKGIPPGILHSIFDPFVTGNEKGTGLGLFIAHQIITNHEGGIEAYNNPDQGATFVMHLPMKEA
ncbi:MAG: ATP-binding protein [bacterium]